MYSIMNNTKWKELQNAMIHDLPFPPPYKMKTIGEKETVDHIFDKDVWYHGDWTDECLCFGDYKNIEWIKVRPRYIQHQGKYVTDKLIDETEKFIEILIKYNIPYEEENGTFLISGYK